jgi:hypothetical protein
MKRKKWYSLIRKKDKHIYGAFPRSREGKQAAVKYLEKLLKREKHHKRKEFAIT